MEELTQAELLVRIPPGVPAVVLDFAAEDYRNTSRVHAPGIQLHCDQCSGLRFFALRGDADAIGSRQTLNTFLTYVCRNCLVSHKTFALVGRLDDGTRAWTVSKYGESPSFGPPTPARAISLIGPDRDEFLKGRRCENQGLGVGAFVYYRRVVENQKNRIFDEILRVTQHLPVDPELRLELEAAKAEGQFTKAVALIKHALPQGLLVNGHNPLLLLHSALSEGVHELSDEECLQLASSVRVVLVEFAERLAQAMKDEAELNDAVNRLASKRPG